MTAEETVTNEETVYLSPPKKNKDETTSSSSGGSSQRQSVAAEQVTTTTQEENKRFVVRSVVDPRDGHDISIQEAVAVGIIDHHAGMYRNPDTGAKKNITQAMNEGLIRIEYVTTTRTPEKVESIGLITIRTQIGNREYTLIGAVDATTAERLDVVEARRRGILDESDAYYYNGATEKRMTLDEAIEAGFVLAEYHTEDGTDLYETKTYAVSAVVDQTLQRQVSFVEAIRRGLIEKDTGSYVNNKTGEKVFAAEAIKRGFFKSVLVDDPSGLNIDAKNRVVVDRGEKVWKNVLRGVKVISALNQYHAVPEAQR